jgi:hypothetical protein
LISIGDWPEYRRLKAQIRSKAAAQSSSSSRLALDAVALAEGDGNYIQSVIDYDDVEYVGNVGVFLFELVLFCFVDHNWNASADV